MKLHSIKSQLYYYHTQHIESAFC